MKYSVIIPVFNRPDEVLELLESLARIDRKDFEVIVVEDGSSNKCDHVVARYSHALQIKYFTKDNEGPGLARNFGYRQASGKYFVAFDSDCLIPPAYFDAVDQALVAEQLDAWGGPDKPHESFTPLQRAMGYTMASVFTTGGIRGAKKKLGWFQPRSFNIGFTRKVFEVTGGFGEMRVSEDIDLSIRIRNAGFKVGLIPDAYVYHKRRTSLSQFYRQVYNFGAGRARLGLIHPEEVKITHWLPTAFTYSLAISVIGFLVSNAFLFKFGCTVFAVYFVAIFVDALRVNKNLGVALLALPAALVQLSGYGTGFFKEILKTYVLK